MIDSLFVLGEDKQIVIEKHWKQTIDRCVLEPYFAALAKYVDVCWNPILLPWRNTSIVMFGSILVGIMYLEYSSRFGKWRVCPHCRKREQSFVHCSGEERVLSPVDRGLYNPDHFCV